MKKLFLNIFLPLLAYITYNAIDLLEIFKKLESKNDKNCKAIRGAVGLEDFELWENQYLIGGSNDNLKMLEMDYNSIEDIKTGHMAVFDTLTEKIRLFNVNKFPEGIAFHPHGVFFAGRNLIYVINHAYNLGGERVEVIEIEKKGEGGIFFNLFLLFLLKMIKFKIEKLKKQKLKS